MFTKNDFETTCCRLRRGATVAFSVDAAAEGAADGNANAAAAPLRETDNGVPGDGVPSPYPSASQPLMMLEASPLSTLAVASANKMSD